MVQSDQSRIFYIFKPDNSYRGSCCGNKPDYNVQCKQKIFYYYMAISCYGYLPKYFLWLFRMPCLKSFSLKIPGYFHDLVKNLSRNTALVLLLPYSVLWLYFSWRDKKEQIEDWQMSSHFPEHKEYDSFL